MYTLIPSAPVGGVRVFHGHCHLHLHCLFVQMWVCVLNIRIIWIFMIMMMWLGGDKIRISLQWGHVYWSELAWVEVRRALTACVLRLRFAIDTWCKWAVFNELFRRNKTIMNGLWMRRASSIVLPQWNTLRCPRRHSDLKRRRVATGKSYGSHTIPDEW